MTRITPDASPASVHVPALFSGGSICKSGTVVGCWFLDRHELLHGGSGWATSESVLWAAWRDGDGAHAIEGVVAPERMPWPGDVKDFHALDWARVKPFQRFLLHADLVDEALDEGDRNARGRVNLLERCRQVAADRFAGTLHDAVCARAVRDLALARDACLPFLSTLDPEARAFSRLRAAQVERAFPILTLYPAIDRTFGTGAPIARSWSWFPGLRLTALSAYKVDPAGFTRAVGDGPASLRELLRVEMSGGYRPHPRQADLAFVACKALQSLSQPERQGIETRLAGYVEDVDPARTAGKTLAWLPASWTPRDRMGWLSFAKCVPAALMATNEAVDGHAGTMLNAKGDWAALSARLTSAHGGPHGARALQKALRDAGDVTKSFADQVLLPAHAMADREGRLPVGASREIAKRCLFSGRSVARILEVSRSWHAGQDRMLAAFPSGGVADSWSACLPDATSGSVTILVLTTRAQLRAEGATGEDETGVGGLAHCVGGYAGRCLAGESRILSLRAGASRLSTAEVSWRDGRVRVAQHRSHGNAEPSAEASRALAAYVADLMTGALRAEAPSLPASREVDHVSERCGYDWRGTGNWEAVHALWRPYLPGPLRLATGRQFARFASDPVNVGNPRWWGPDPVRLPS